MEYIEFENEFKAFMKKEGLKAYGNHITYKSS